MRKNISDARLETTPVIDEAHTLISQREQVQTKQSLLRAFKQHFLLTDSELTKLTSTSEPVNDDFFQTLVKAKAIHKDCQVLLRGENQRLGLEILDQINKTLTSAFQTLYRWIQREVKSIDLENSQMSFSIRRALRVLAERPTLFQSCLDTFAEARESSLSDAFYAALTGTSKDHERQRPIEFSAHEPLRYLGDMLAWAHATAVSEREALEILFISEGNEIAKSIQEGLESEPWSKPESGEIFDGRRAVGQLIDRNLAGVAQLLRQRIEQVIHTHDEPVLEYKFANLVVFYKNIFRKLLENEGFLQTLDALEGAALERFKSTMKFQVVSAQNEQFGIPDGLSPPEALEDGLEQLKSLLSSYDTSVAATDSTGESLQLLFEEALDPFVEECSKLSKSLPEPQSHCFLINCLLATTQRLSDYAFAQDKIKTLDRKVQERGAVLSEYQHSWFLRSSGVKPLVDTLSQLGDSQDSIRLLKSSSAFSPESVLDTRQTLDDFLPSALTDALENLGQLKSSALTHEITDEAVRWFFADFERVEEAIVAASTDMEAQRENESEGDREPSLREIFPRTSEDIRILLS